MALRVNPVSDGWTCTGCQPVGGELVAVGGSYQGLIKFSGAAAGPGVQQAWLAMNHYYASFSDRDIAVFGSGSAVAQLSAGEGDSGAFLGLMHIPAGVAASEDVYFDVTSFVRGAAAPYLTFTLQANDIDVFSSLELNRGHAAQLILASVPEPGAGALMFAGLLGLAAWLRRRQCACAV